MRLEIGIQTVLFVLLVFAENYLLVFFYLLQDFGQKVHWERLPKVLDLSLFICQNKDRVRAEIFLNQSVVLQRVFNRKPRGSQDLRKLL